MISLVASLNHAVRSVLTAENIFVCVMLLKVKIKLLLHKDLMTKLNFFKSKVEIFDKDILVFLNWQGRLRVILLALT
jgi:hypothetical protein